MPYMTGMLNDALVRYHTSFEQDGRIPGAVKRSVDQMWSSSWVSPGQYFLYIEGGPCREDGAPELNALSATGFAFVARQTGDASYFAKGDQVFAGGAYFAWIGGPKHFNQQYTSAFRYLALRF
jgi:hypothetical protein